MNRDYIWVGVVGNIFVFLILFCISQISYNELTNFANRKKYFVNNLKLCVVAPSVLSYQSVKAKETNTFSRNNKNCLQTTSLQTYPSKGDPEGCRAS